MTLQSLAQKMLHILHHRSIRPSTKAVVTLASLTLSLHQQWNRLYVRLATLLATLSPSRKTTILLPGSAVMLAKIGFILPVQVLRARGRYEASTNSGVENANLSMGLQLTFENHRVLIAPLTTRAYIKGLLKRLMKARSTITSSQSKMEPSLSYLRTSPECVPSW